MAGSYQDDLEELADRLDAKFGDGADVNNVIPMR